MVMEANPESAFGRRDTGALLGNSFGIYWRNFLKLAVSTLLPALPLACLGIVAIVYFFRFLNNPETSSFFDEIYNPSWIAVIVIFYLLMLLTVVVINAAVIHAASQYQLLRAVSIKQAYRRVFQRFWPLLGVSILSGLAVIMLELTIIGIPLACYFGIRWSFVVQAVIVENRGVRDSFSRSSQLVREHWWLTFGLQLMWEVIVIAITWILELIFWLVLAMGSVFGDSYTTILWIFLAVGYVLFLLVMILLYPLQYMLPALLYFDLRARREEFTPEMLAEDMDMVAEYQENRASTPPEAGI